MSRRSRNTVTRRNRTRQWLREQKEWQSHGHPPKQRNLDYRHSRKYKSVLVSVIQHALTGNSHFIVFPSDSSQTAGEVNRPQTTVEPYQAQVPVKTAAERPVQSPVTKSFPAAVQKDETMDVHCGLEQNGVTMPRCLIAGGCPPGPLP